MQCIGKTCSCGHLCAYIETICSREYAKNTCTYFFNSDQTQSHCNLFQKYGRKLFLQIKQNVIQFLLAMISGQLSNSRQSLIQLCAIQKWYNRKIMQKCEYGNQGNLRQTLKEYFRQNYFKMIPWGNWMIEVSKFWLKCLCSFSMQPRRKFFLLNFKQNLNNSRSLLVARVKMQTSNSFLFNFQVKKALLRLNFSHFLIVLKNISCGKIFPVEKIQNICSWAKFVFCKLTYDSWGGKFWHICQERTRFNSKDKDNLLGNTCQKN